MRGSSWPPVRRLSSMLVASLAALPVTGQADGLPPHPVAMTFPAATTPERAELFLDLRINGAPARKEQRVLQRKGRLFVRAVDLASAGVDLAQAGLLVGQEWVDVAGLPDSKVSLDSHALVLDLTVPVQWLPQRYLGPQRQGWQEPQGGYGAVINYDARVARQRGAPPGTPSRHATLWSEQRIFGGAGILSNTGLWRHSDVDPGTPGSNGYRRLDTTWTWLDESSSTSLAVGDVVTGAQGWGSTVRLGGFRIARDYRLRPDLVTWPVPQFAGRAGLPSTVELFVDGRRAAGGNVLPGTFVLEGLPMMTGAGEATIVTTDMLGRQTAITLPFYVTSDLLRAGFAHGSLSAGLIRRAYGIESASYGEPAASASVRHGVTDWLTGEFQMDIAPELGVVGAGAVVGLGRLGVANGSVSHSEFQATHGRQLTFGYRYARRGFNVGYRGIRREEGFTDFGSLSDELVLAPWRMRRADIASLGYSAGRAGTISLGYFDTVAVAASRARFATIAWSMPLVGRSSLHVSASKDLRGGGHGLLAQFLLPLGQPGTLSAGLARNQDGGYSSHLGYSRVPPLAGGLGWNLGYSWHDQADDYLYASLSWSNPYLQADVGSYGTPGDRTDWAGLRGALVAIGGRLFVTRQVHDAFTLVSTGGVGGVPVRYENQLVGRTDHRGHLLVPNVAAYYPAKYEIDPLELPTGLRIADVERRIAVRKGSGTLLEFPLSAASAALVSLVDDDGLPLPIGTTIRHAESSQEAVVGYDGLAYLENLGARNTLTARRPDGQDCRVSFSLEPNALEMASIGPLRCD